MAEQDRVLPWLSRAGCCCSSQVLPFSTADCGGAENSSGDVTLTLSMCTWGVLNPRVADVINNNVSFGAVTTYHVNGHLGSL